MEENTKKIGYLVLLHDWLEHLKRSETDKAFGIEICIQEMQKIDYIKSNPDIRDLYMDIDIMRSNVESFKSPEGLEKDLDDAISYISDKIDKYKSRD